MVFSSLSRLSMILHIATLKRLFHIDPVSTDAVCHPLSSLLYQTLIRINRSGDAATAELAADWIISADYRRFSFTLAENFFHDGRPVLASHVAHSLARHVWPDSPSIFAELLRELIVGANECVTGEIPAGLYADDEKNHLLIHLKQSYCPFLEVLAHPAMGISLQLNTGQILGSGPMCLSSEVHQTDDDAGHWQLSRHTAYAGQRHLPEQISILRYAHFDELALAYQGGQLDAVLLERKHQLRLDAMPGAHSSHLRDRWAGMLIMNAAGIFDQRELRRDFHALVQKQAHQDLGAAYHADFIPVDILRPTVLPVHDISPGDFQIRWARHFLSGPVRIIYAAGRGPLSAGLDCAITVLQACGIAYELIMTENPAQVYEVVATGNFDLVARGWIQDYDDADQYVGMYEKQAPQAQARSAYLEFYAAIAAARFLPDPQQRLSAYATATDQLNAQYLYITISRDHHRIFHRENLRLQTGCRDPFDL